MQPIQNPSMHFYFLLQVSVLISDTFTPPITPSTLLFPILPSPFFLLYNLWYLKSLSKQVSYSYSLSAAPYGLIDKTSIVVSFDIPMKWHIPKVCSFSFPLSFFFFFKFYLWHHFLSKLLHFPDRKINQVLEWYLLVVTNYSLSFIYLFLVFKLSSYFFQIKLWISES